MINTLIRTDTRYPVNRKVVRRAVADVVGKDQFENLDLEVSVSVVGKRKMKAIASAYLGDLEVHDVLSFALEETSSQDMGQGFINPPDEVLRLGDVVLCWPEVLEAASRDEVMVDDQLYKLTHHGVEHLLGKHHE